MQKIRSGPTGIVAGTDPIRQRDTLCGKLDGNAAGRGERVALNGVEANGEGTDLVGTSAQVLVETVRATVEPFQFAGQFVVHVVKIAALPAAHILLPPSRTYGSVKKE